MKISLLNDNDICIRNNTIHWKYKYGRFGFPQSKFYREISGFFRHWLDFGSSQRIYINYLNDGRRYNFEKFNLFVRCENSRYPSRIGEIQRLYIFPRHFFPIPNCLECIFDGMRNGLDEMKNGML